jgi:tetratricopeptide (TPR) repeat protein
MLRQFLIISIVSILLYECSTNAESSKKKPLFESQIDSIIVLRVKPIPEVADYPSKKLSLSEIKTFCSDWNHSQGEGACKGKINVRINVYGKDKKIRLFRAYGSMVKENSDQCYRFPGADYFYRLYAGLTDTSNNQTIRTKIKALDDSIQKNPTNPQFYYDRAFLYHDLKMIDKSIADFSKVIELYAFSRYAFYNRASIRLESKRSNKAFKKLLPSIIEDLTEAIIIDSSYYLAWYKRGKAHFSLGSYTQSIFDYSKAIDLDTTKSEPLVGRGRCWYLKANLKEAQHDFDKAIKIDPTNSVAYYERGNLKFTLKQYKEAISDLDKAIAINSSYSEAYLIRSMCKTKLGMIKEGLSDINSANALNINNIMDNNQ